MEFVKVTFGEDGGIDVKINLPSLAEKCESTEQAVQLAEDIADNIVIKARDYNIVHRKRTILSMDDYGVGSVSTFNIRRLAKVLKCDEYDVYIIAMGFLKQYGNSLAHSDSDLELADFFSEIFAEVLERVKK